MLLCPAVHHLMDNGPQGRQCRLLHRQPKVILVHGDTGHDRRHHLGRHLHLRPRCRAARGIFLHADGFGLLRRLHLRGFRTDTALLSDEPDEHLRLSGEPLRPCLLPHGCLVLLRIQDAGGIGTLLCGVRRVAIVGLHPAERTFLIERSHHGRPHLALLFPRRRQVAYMDRFAENHLPCAVGSVLHRLHCRQPQPGHRRPAGGHWQPSHQPDVLL